MRRSRPPAIIDARRPGTCAETGAAFKPGARILWDYSQSLAYCETSRRFLNAAQQERADNFNRAYNMPDANW